MKSFARPEDRNKPCGAVQINKAVADFRCRYTMAHPGPHVDPDRNIPWMERELRPARTKTYANLKLRRL